MMKCFIRFYLHFLSALFRYPTVSLPHTRKLLLFVPQQVVTAAAFFCRMYVVGFWKHCELLTCRNYRANLPRYDADESVWSSCHSDTNVLHGGRNECKYAQIVIAQRCNGAFTFEEGRLLGENVLDGIKTQFLCICVDMALCHIYSGDSKENQFTQSLHEDPPPLWWQSSPH